jgi:hypothetical protein
MRIHFNEVRGQSKRRCKLLKKIVLNPGSQTEVSERGPEVIGSVLACRVVFVRSSPTVRTSRLLSTVGERHCSRATD